ncbi:hypothetical protein BJX99DRAFT_242722 [Aspergillus californicus]
MGRLKTIHRRASNKSKAKSQQHQRQADTLFYKAFEFSKECDADVMLVIQLKKNGQIYIFNSNNEWFPSQDNLALCYPTPLQITSQDMATKYEGKQGER